MRITGWLRQPYCLSRVAVALAIKGSCASSVESIMRRHLCLDWKRWQWEPRHHLEPSVLCLDRQAFIKVLWFLCVNNFKLTPIKIWSGISFPGGSDSKEPASNSGDLGLIPGLGRSPGKRKGYPLQYSGLEHSMDCIVQGVTKSWRTWLSNIHFQPLKKVESQEKGGTCLWVKRSVFWSWTNSVSIYLIQLDLI